MLYITICECSITYERNLKTFRFVQRSKQKCSKNYKIHEKKTRIIKFASKCIHFYQNHYKVNTSPIYI